MEGGDISAEHRNQPEKASTGQIWGNLSKKIHKGNKGL